MASNSLRESLAGLFNCRRAAYQRLHKASQIRSLTTEVSSPAQIIDQTYADVHLSSAPTRPILNDTFTTPSISTSASRQSYQPPPNPFATRATCILYDFPSLEPVGTRSYTRDRLLLPLRRDILHRAVIYEGDKTRQGTASTKWRGEVHGSNRKIRPQKGTGSARLGNKKSPMLKGGGVAFGPKPRDFSTELPKKIYDLAWRTALSYRHRRGELIVLSGEAEIQREGPGTARWVTDMLNWHKWGNAHGRTLFVTFDKRERLFNTLEQDDMGRQAKALTVEDVDVKNLLEMGRVVIEQKALSRLFRDHSAR